MSRFASNNDEDRRYGDKGEDPLLFQVEGHSDHASRQRDGGGEKQPAEKD
jgi:hypothetical protein